MNLKKATLILSACMSCGFMGCVDSDCIDGMCMDDYSQNRQALSAYCSINVSGYGSVSMETDYVPNVTCCENGGAPDQALRAQSVSARTFAYYKLDNGAGTTSNPIKNSEGDQVYKCGGRADSRLPACKAATNDTSGMVLQYSGKTICGFYVSGEKGDCLDASCKAKAGCNTHPQPYVTYNEGKTGNNITQSAIGWVSTSNIANRGCMSQNGASCLDSKRGYNWVKIVKFFYGDDIKIVKAAGNCVQAAATIPGDSGGGSSQPVVQCTTKLDKSGVIIDEKNPCFTHSNVSSWYELNKGYDNHLNYTYTWGEAAEAIGQWNINVTRPGKYEVFAFIQGDAVSAAGAAALSAQAPYVVRASGKETKVPVNLRGKNGWVSLGKFDFANGGDQWVKLTDASGETYNANAKNVIFFDAIKFEDAVTCTNSCDSNGKTECSGNGVRKCADSNGDGCLEWSPVTACGENKECKNGGCVDKAAPATCSDECPKAGLKECSGDGGWHECGSFDDDSCLEWSAVTSCRPDQKCVDAACVADTALSCTHDCAMGDTMCDGTSAYKECGFFDDDNCRDWSESRACKEGETCQFGSCTQSAASTGSKACVLEIDGRESTIIDDLDPCFERSNVIWSQLSSYGYSDHLFYAPVNKTETDNSVGTWHLNVTKSGKYIIKAYIESGIGNVVDNALYTVFASGKKNTFKVHIEDASGWVKIGTFELAEGKDQYVRLSDNSFVEGENYTDKRFVFDAIKVEPWSEDADTSDEPADSSDESSEDEGNGTPHTVSTSSSDCSANPIQTSSSSSLLALLSILGLGLMRRRKTAKI